MGSHAMTDSAEQPGLPDPSDVFGPEFSWGECIRAELALRIAEFGADEHRLALLRHPDCTTAAVLIMLDSNRKNVVDAALAHPLCPRRPERRSARRSANRGRSTDRTAHRRAA